MLKEIKYLNHKTNSITILAIQILIQKIKSPPHLKNKTFSQQTIHFQYIQQHSLCKTISTKTLQRGTSAQMSAFSKHMTTVHNF